jgi:dolichol-phosphate mannosyltransferase
MKKLPFLYIVVPVFNEAENVRSFLGSLKELRERVSHEFGCRVVIVDDGSTDATRECIEQHRNDLQMTLLSHALNRGPGSAFNTAFRYLRERLQEDDWVVTMEGDNTSQTDTLLHMLKRKNEGYDVVLGSAYAYGGGILGVETSRIFLSHCANALAKLLLGLRGFHTLSSFFRVYSAHILKRLQLRFGPGIIEFGGFECMVELLLKLVMAQAKISEVEMQLDWNKRKGHSKMRIFKAALGYIRLLNVGWQWRQRAGSSLWSPLKRS